MTAPTRARTFTYAQVSRVGHEVVCTYDVDGTVFRETATFSEDVALDDGAVEALSELYFLLAGLSYYKTGAARTIAAPGLVLGDADVKLLRGAIDGGLGEFALRNDLDLRDVALPDPRRRDPRRLATTAAGPLVPFGGGIDSIVTVETRDEPDAALFVVSPPSGPFEAIERAAAVTRLPVVRCTRAIDPSLLCPPPAWFAGHVPVTAIVSSLALVAAAAQGRPEVRMSNERSASAATVVHAGRPVNHQWSKSAECEGLLAAAVASRVSGTLRYRSALRDRSELWVAREFARHSEYHRSFMSCNRAFRQARAERATTWCGACDKCLFTDLVLAPFLDRTTLEDLFGGHEPLADPGQLSALEVLVGVAPGPRPFECVGDADECAAALVAAAVRPDRADQCHLADLAARCSAPPLAALFGHDPEREGADAARHRL